MDWRSVAMESEKSKMPEVHGEKAETKNPRTLCAGEVRSRTMNSVDRRTVIKGLATVFAVVGSIRGVARAQEPNEVECGATVTGGTIAVDNDCRPATATTHQDLDCGGLESTVWGGSYHGDGDCNDLSGTPGEGRDMDCGKASSWNGGAMNDADCGMPDVSFSTQDQDCGLELDKVQGGTNADSDCGNANAPGNYNTDNDCGIEASFTDSDCGTPAGAVGGIPQTHKDGDDGTEPA